MSELARTNFELSENFTNNPLIEIFERGASLMPGASLKAKTCFIAELTVCIEKMEVDSENIKTRNYWSSIISGFSAAFAIGSSTALNPVLGGIVGGGAVVSAIASIWCNCTENAKLEPLTQTLRRVRLALKSQAPVQWAALWEVAGTQMFVCSLRPASAGHVTSDGRLAQIGEDSPFQRAVEFVADMRGLSFGAVIEEGQAVLGKAEEQPRLPAQFAPTIIQPAVTKIQPETPLFKIEKINQLEPISEEPVWKDEDVDLSEDLNFFDWYSLQDADEHPVIALVAGMGGGKTRLVKFLTRHIIFDGAKEFDAIAFDIFAGGADWDGFMPICDPGKMIEQMKKDMKLLERRLEAYRNKIRNFTPMIRVIEEGRSTIPKLQKTDSKTVEEWQLEFTSVTRKLKARAFYINTELDAASMGVKAGTRNDMTIIFPGAKGIAKAMKDTSILKLGSKQNEKLREELSVKLKQCDRPALVYHCGDWYAAAIPTVDENGTPSWHEDFIDECSGQISVPEAKFEDDNWDRFVLESTEDEINELIEQRRNGDKLGTIDEQLDFALKAIVEYLADKQLADDTARNIYNGKNRLKRIAPKLNDFKDTLELLAEMDLISYDVQSGVVKIL